MVLPSTFVKKLDSNSSKLACANGVMDFTCLRQHVSLLVCFYKIIFKERANSSSKTRRSFYSFCCGALYHFKYKSSLLDGVKKRDL